VIAVVGAGGQLGSGFLRLLGAEAMAVTRDQLDLRDRDQVGPWVVSTRPELVLNCAAYTAVDAAEDDEDTARLVNATAAGRLAEATSALGIKLVTFSTDYVFDGSKQSGYVESDSTNPLNVYGATKLEGERLALAANPAALVIRTSWVLSGTHRNFAETMIDMISKGPVRVVDDQRGRPTLVDDLAAVTISAIEQGATGLLHLTNQGATTWFGLAREVAEIAGLDPERVESISTAEFPRSAPRPANSVLDSERLDDLGLAPLPHYRPSLERAVEQLMSRAGYA
jgi:dTDP-4-dehydrorhamnose reductase